MFADLISCPDRLALWAAILDRIKPQTALEIGVWKGAFARHVLKMTPTISRYYMLDPWRPLPNWNKPLNADHTQFEMAYRAAIDATSFAGERAIVLRGTTTEVIDQVADEALDFIYVDGDHTLRGISIDLVNAYRKLKPGGYLGGDDFIPTIWQHGVKFEPTLVFPFAVYFAEGVGAHISALPFSQFIIRKPESGRNFQFDDPENKFREQSLLKLMAAAPHPPSLARRAGRKLLRLLRQG